MTSERTKKKLLIIKSKKQGLNSVETFLKNRDWELQSTDNLKDALLYLVQHQPEFVMISIDHPNKRVRNLPKVLAQAFPTCVIVFSEDNTAANHQLLEKYSTKYMLYPPVTGPAVERTVNRYYKDLQTDGFQTTKQAFDSRLKADGMISIRGDAVDANTAAENFLAGLLKDDGDSILQNGITGAAHSATEENNTGINHQSTQSGSASRNFFANSEAPQAKPNGPLWGAIEQNKYRARTSRTSEEIELDPRSNKTDSLIFRGSKDALASAVLNSSVGTLDTFSEARIACITIESNRFCGYLLTMTENTQEANENLVTQIRQRLFHFLKSHGETVEDHELMNLKLQSVPFDDWALEQADFLRKTRWKDQEISMAFFPCSSVKYSFIESADQKMWMVPLAELKDDTAVEFNLYVYLPRNNRYVLYTPRGGILYGKQKERLSQQGISQMHVLKDETADIQRHHVQNYLNSKISEFEKEKELA
jgi:hypothetical protein